MSLEVNDISIGDALEALKRKQYSIPRFQREFRWTIDQVTELAWSIVRGRPIGMITLWECNPDDDLLDPRPVRIEETPPPEFRVFVDEDADYQGTSYVVLDGQQRLTALALLFGGLRTENAVRRTSGRFFLDLNASPDSNPIRHFRRKKVLDDGLDTPNGALRRGFLPLEIKEDEGGQWDFDSVWGKLSNSLFRDPEHIFDADGIPSKKERERWQEVIQKAKAGLMDVKIATYAVDQSFDLGDICEIFETLNTTGTQVSTVDLIHSNLVYETKDAKPVMELRDWMDNGLGSENGAEGWSESKGRPELLAQLATASYIGLQGEKPEPRQIGVRKDEITSIKASDLLRLPASYWLDLRSRQAEFAATIGAFQNAVADAHFPMAWCPYPASASIYIGLSWSKRIEEIEEDECWDLIHLDGLYRAFFWRNALSGRYDQGFLTKVTTDMRDLRDILRLKAEPEFSSPDAWAKEAGRKLGNMMEDSPLPGMESLTDVIANGTLTGARKSAIELFVRSRAKKDIVSGDPITYPEHEQVDMHHIYPKKWMSNNKTGALKEAFDEAKRNDWHIINCIANLVPLSSATNQEWKAMNPGQALGGMKFSGPLGPALQDAFIDKGLFDKLVEGDAVNELRSFHEGRARLIAEALLDNTEVTL